MSTRMELLGVAIACAGVACGASAPFFLKKRYAFMGNSAVAAGAACNVLAAQFAPQSEIQPLAGLMVLASVAIEACITKKRPPNTRRFWLAVVGVALGDASIVAWSPPMRKHVDPHDANVLWMILVGAGIVAGMLLGDVSKPHWAWHGARPGIISGFAITSTNAFVAAASGSSHHKNLAVFGIFAVGFSVVQLVLVNQAAQEVSEIDFQSVYVSTIIVSGTLVGLTVLDEPPPPHVGRWVWLAVSLCVVVRGAYVVAREHAAHKHVSPITVVV